MAVNFALLSLLAIRRGQDRPIDDYGGRDRSEAARQWYEASPPGTASVAGLVGLAERSAYVASKHGVVGITRTAALEYAPQGIPTDNAPRRPVSL